MPEQIKFQLEEKQIPDSWYNIAADLPSPLPPPLNPATGQPLGPDDLAPLFPLALIEQEVPELALRGPRLRRTRRFWFVES